MVELSSNFMTSSPNKSKWTVLGHLQPHLAASPACTGLVQELQVATFSRLPTKSILTFGFVIQAQEPIHLNTSGCLSLYLCRIRI